MTSQLTEETSPEEGTSTFNSWNQDKKTEVDVGERKGQERAAYSVPVEKCGCTTFSN